MATNFTPIWPQDGYDIYGSNHSTVSIDINNLSLYYYYQYPFTIDYGRGKYFVIGKKDNADEEFIYISQKSISRIYAIKTNLNSPSSPYSIAGDWTVGGSMTAIPLLINDANTEAWLISATRNGVIGSFGFAKTDPLTGVTTYSQLPFTPGDNYNNACPYTGGGLTAFQNNFYAGGHSKAIRASPINMSSQAPLWATAIGNAGHYNAIYIRVDPVLISGLYYLVYLCRDEGSGVFWLYKLQSNDGTSIYGISKTGGGTTYGYILNSDTGTTYVMGDQNIQSYSTLGSLVSTFPSSGTLPYSNLSNGCMSTNGTIYFRAGTNLYALQDDGLGNLSQKYMSSILPNPVGSLHYASPIIDGSGRIIVCSDATGVSNVHIFEDNGSYLKLLYTFPLPFSASGIRVTPEIGSNGILYIVNTNNTLFAFGSGFSPTTTTTTTTPAPVTTTTTTGTGTTTTTTSTATTTPTTTTTTTTLPPPLAKVQTIQFEQVNGQFVPVQTSNASDDSTTQNLLVSQALNFGTIAPNETSKTVIIALNVPYTQAITNIKLGLTSTGGITFANNIFGITNSVELRNDITPDNYFQGVNSSKSSTSAYNINILNKDDHTSQYVYLNVKLPQDHIFGEGMVTYKWFFDYC